MMRSVTMLFLLLCITACMVKCAWSAECKVEWDAAPVAEQVTKWRIYRGLVLLTETTTASATLDLPADALSTLSVVAVNVAGTSSPASLTVIPFTPRHSDNLTTWTQHPAKIIFLESKPRLFASYSFPKP
jgi:hypothetical protein